MTVTAPGGPIVLARDQFERTTSGGWGSAELGGTWATTGSGSWYSVTGGQGRHALSGGRTAATRLPTLADVSITARVKLSFTAAPTGGGYYSYLNLRRNGTTSYQLRPRFMPGSTTLTLFRVLNGSSTSLGSVTVPGGAHVPGQVWELELSASQTSPTTLSARLWNSASPRPATPQITATDSTAALQQPGGLELSTYLSSSSTGAPTALFDDLVVTSP